MCWLESFTSKLSTCTSFVLIIQTVLCFTTGVRANMHTILARSRANVCLNVSYVACQIAAHNTQHRQTELAAGVFVCFAKTVLCIASVLLICDTDDA